MFKPLMNRTEVMKKNHSDIWYLAFVCNINIYIYISDYINYYYYNQSNNDNNHNHLIAT